VAALIAAQRDQHRIPAAVACRALGVSRSWYCKWKGGTLPPRTLRRERLKGEVARLFGLHGGKYGAPRITADLREAGWRVSENTVAAVMRELGLAARRPRRRRSATRQGKGRWRAPDLVRRNFGTPAVNRKWYGDGTEIATAEGKLHLDSVLDMGSRRVLGFALGEHHDARLACGALAMAVAVRGGRVPGVILHTDQGSRIHRAVLPAGMRTAGHHSVHGQARLGPGQRRHRVLALHLGMGAAARAALRHPGAGPVGGGGLDRGLQHRPPAFRPGHAQPGRLRTGPGGRGGSLRCPLPATPGSAGARPCPGRSSSGHPALRVLHLDSPCATAVTWQLTGSGTSKISSIQCVHASRGTPIDPLRCRPVALIAAAARDAAKAVQPIVRRTDTMAKRLSQPLTLRAEAWVQGRYHWARRWFPPLAGATTRPHAGTSHSRGQASTPTILRCFVPAAREESRVWCAAGRRRTGPARRGA
jgi:putative transposase